ncbi:hypothetical protein BDW72DRAFT_135292 [Aspergillus terricola var. indicus]
MNIFSINFCDRCSGCLSTITPFSPTLFPQSILYYNISQSLFRQFVRACSMTIFFSCLYWLSEALLVLGLLACHLSLLFFSPSADDPRLRRWICEYASCKGLWLLLLFIREDDSIFESIAGVCTCEDPPYVKGVRDLGRYPSTFSSGVPFLEISLFPDSSFSHLYISISRKFPGLVAFVPLRLRLIPRNPTFAEIGVARCQKGPSGGHRTSRFKRRGVDRLAGIAI